MRKRVSERVSREVGIGTHECRDTGRDKDPLDWNPLNSPPMYQHKYMTAK